MRYSLIIAGGSGTRLWPMSRAAMPKQLIPFIDGQSLLELSDQRLEGLVPVERRYICAGQGHRDAIVSVLGLDPERFIGEPMGRDTLNAVALGAAVIGRRDPEAVIGVFTADHVIRPVEQFQHIVDQGFALAEARPDTLVTFGIAPTHAATGYGYLELGESLQQGDARRVERFKEKPVAEVAQQYFDAGPQRYLWNSGMFVWRAATLLDCVRRYEPQTHAGLERIAAAWDTPQRDAVLSEVYPTLRKISVDFAVMEPAAADPHVTVAAVPMPLDWLDVGSWPSYAQTLPRDRQGNATGTERVVHIDCRNTLVASNDPGHLVAAVGCEDLIVIHTPDATLICRADRAEDIKKVHALVGERFGKALQ